MAHRIGLDPAELGRQRTARAGKTQGQAAEHPADVAAYIARSRARRVSVPTPGSRPSADASAGTSVEPDTPPVSSPPATPPPGKTTKRQTGK